MGLMWQWKVTHTDCITNLKRKKMIHERGKVKDERQWFVNVDGEEKLIVRKTIPSNNCFKVESANYVLGA